MAWRSPWPTARLTYSPPLQPRSMPPHAYSASVVPGSTARLLRALGGTASYSVLRHPASGTRPPYSPGRSMPSACRSSACAPVLEAAAPSVVHARAQLVEEHVRGDLDGPAPGTSVPNTASPRVLELAAAVAEDAGIAERRVGVMTPLSTCGERGDRLEGRARGIAGVVARLNSGAPFSSLERAARTSPGRSAWRRRSRRSSGRSRARAPRRRAGPCHEGAGASGAVARGRLDRRARPRSAPRAAGRGRA